MLTSCAVKQPLGKLISVTGPQKHTASVSEEESRPSDLIATVHATFFRAFCYLHAVTHPTGSRRVTALPSK